MSASGNGGSEIEGDYSYKSAADAAAAALEIMRNKKDQCTDTKLAYSHFVLATELLEAQAEGRITVGVPAIAEGMLKIRELAGEDCKYGLGSLDVALGIVGHYGLSVAGHDLTPQLGKGHAERVQR